MSEATSSPAPAPAATPAAPAVNPADGQQIPAPAPGTPTPAPSSTPAAPPPPPPVEAKEGTPTGAPEAYADFTLPEGVQADAPTLEKFKATAKELGLPQDAAQKLVTLQAEAQIAQANAVRTQWQEQAKVDKEFGGDKFDENLAVAKKALERFASPEFNAFLNASGLGNHPELIRAFYRAGKAISEDGFVPGRSGQQGGDSVAQRLFPNMNP